MEEGHTVLKKNLLRQLLALLLPALHVSLQHLLRCRKSGKSCSTKYSHLQRPLRPVGGVAHGLVTQPGPDQVEEVGKQPGVGDSGQALLADVAHRLRQRRAVGQWDHLFSVELSSMQNNIYLFEDVLTVPDHSLGSDEP